MQASAEEQDIRAAIDEPALWPNFSQAADMLGLSKGTLSKQAQAGQIAYEVLGLGGGRHVISPVEVLRLSSRYRRVSQAIIVDRLVDFFSIRSQIDAETVRQVISGMAEGADRHARGGDPRNKTDTGGSRTPISIGSPAAQQASAWLLEVEELRRNPAALVGAVSFTSADDPIGRIDLGPSVDEPSSDDVEVWQSL